MPKPILSVTPDNRVDRWKKMWATPRKLTQEETELAFEEFQDALVPRHMHKQFLRFFGLPKSKFGNRFFKDGALYVNWDSKLANYFGMEGPHLEATVIYGSPDRLEAHVLRGERRRSFRDIIIDDWHTACAIVKDENRALYIFVEPKMRGVIVLIVPLTDAPMPDEE